VRCYAKSCKKIMKNTEYLLRQELFTTQQYILHEDCEYRLRRPKSSTIQNFQA
jgi:hypothetical protein